LAVQQFCNEFLYESFNLWCIAPERCTRKQLTNHAPTSLVRSTIAVCQGAAAQQQTNTLRPPPLKTISLCQQVSDGLIPLDEHNALTEERRLEEITMGLKATLSKRGITEKCECL
jgi:hypothetical protein